MCQVVAYRRLKAIENFKQSSLKVVVTRGGRLREVVAYEVPSIVI